MTISSYVVSRASLLNGESGPAHVICFFLDFVIRDDVDLATT